VNRTSSAFRRHGLAATLALASLLAPATASAQAAKVIPLIINIAAWLGSTISEHYLDKALDKGDEQLVRQSDEALAKRYKTQLEQASTSLNKGPDATALDRAALQSIQNQLSAINGLLAQQQISAPARAVIQAQQQSDLAAMQVALRQRDKTVADLNQRLTTLEGVIAQLRAASARLPSAPLPPPAVPLDRPRSSPATVKPSFDCGKAKTFVEQEICGSDRLSGLDADLGKIYWELRGSLPAPASARLRLEEIAWLRQRDYLLRSVCVGSNEHLDTECAAFFWNQRIAALKQEEAVR